MKDLVISPWQASKDQPFVLRCSISALDASGKRQFEHGMLPTYKFWQGMNKQEARIQRREAKLKAKEEKRAKERLRRRIARADVR